MPDQPYIEYSEEPIDYDCWDYEAESYVDPDVCEVCGDLLDEDGTCESCEAMQLAREAGVL
jgi:hypothetical protein